MLEQDERDIDLIGAAFAMAEEEYPGLDVNTYRGKLERMARALRDKVPADAATIDKIVSLNRFMFAEHGFRGNHVDYYDPKNSFLSDVLERKLGIPITLCIVYLWLARGIGLNAQGLAFPGHFLVKVVCDNGVVIVDCFEFGATLTEQTLRDRLKPIYGADVAESIDLARFLGAATRKDIIARMLRNLEHIYVERGESAKALRVIDHLLALHPESARDWRTRGLLNWKLECYRAALGDLQHYLELAPDADDVDEVRVKVFELRQINARLN